MIPIIEHVQRWVEPFVDDLLDEERAILLEGPRGSGKSKSSQLMHLILSELRQERIGINRLADDFGMSASDARGLMLGLVPVSV